MGVGSSTAVVERRSGRGWLVAIALGVPVALLALFIATKREEYELFAAVVGFIEALIFFMLPAIAPDGLSAKNAKVRVHADREGIVVGKKLLLARRDIESMWIEELRDGTQRVHFAAKRARDDLALLVENDAGARALIEALDLQHDRHAATFAVESAPLRTPLMQQLVRAMIWMGGLALSSAVVYFAIQSAFIGFLLVPVLLVYSMILRRMRSTTRVAIGDDGLVVRAHGALQQIPLNAITKITKTQEKREVVLDVDRSANAKAQNLLLRFAGNAAEEKANAFVKRARAAQIHLREQDDAESQGMRASLFARAGRPIPQWLEDLRRVGGGGAAEGYRECALPDEELWRILEHPAADSSARAGALIALRSRLDELGRIRIAQIAGATAHQDLRAALDAATAGESETDIAEAFDAATKK